LTRSQVLAAGFRKYGDGVDDMRVCLSYAYTGLMAMAYSNIGKPSPPPLIIDLVPAHTQTEFNKKSGSARIDASNMDIAELIIQHVFAAYDHAFIEGWDNINLIKKVIHKLKLVSIFLSDAMISGVIDDYRSPRARYDLEDSLPIILVFNQETKKTTIIFTCMQISSAIGGPTRSNRMSGKMYIPIIHELVCAFLDVSGANNRTTAIPSFTTGDVSIFRQALYKDGATKITKDLRLHGLLPESVEFLSPSQAGYENGIGMMSAEARMAAYENGIGMMSAEARMAASKKGYENGLGKAAKREWTAEVDASIIRMIGDGFSYAKIALKLGNGLSKSVVDHRWNRKLRKSSGITKPAVQPGCPSRITWTADVDATIERMKADGFSYAQIAAELGNGLSKSDIVNRWTHHLKLQ
jgi:hypothetical protein